MKILLLRPPFRYLPGAAKPSIGFPVGLLQIASVLEKNHFSVELLDAQMNVRSPFLVDADGNGHMGLPWDALSRTIEERKPDIVGITCPFTTQIGNAIKTAEIARKAAPETVTVVGGNHPTARPEDFFRKTAAVDLVCIAEGEYTMRDIAEAVRRGNRATGIPGTAERDGDGGRSNPPRDHIGNLDELPLPAYHLVDMEAYFHLYKHGFNDRPIGHGKDSERAVSVITSRGCPFDCVFCSIHLHLGRKWRAHSVEYVRMHIEYLISKYGIRHIHFEDDNISANVKRFKGLLEAFQNLGNVFSWDTPNGVRVDTLSKEILRDCKRSGCVYLVFGVESGNQSVLDRIVGKKLDLDTVTKAAAWCREISLDAMSFFVIGFPGETRRDMKDTVDFALRLQREYDVNPGLFVATPLPGTRLERICIEKGLLESEPSPDILAKITQGAVILDGDTFSAEDVREMRDKFLKGYRRNVVTNLAAFLSRNPGTLPAFTREVLSGRRNGSLRDALLSAYLIKNSIAKRP